jgi:hypothetical protein
MHKVNGFDLEIRSHSISNYGDSNSYEYTVRSPDLMAVAEVTFSYFDGEFQGIDVFIMRHEFSFIQDESYINILKEQFDEEMMQEDVENGRESARTTWFS